MTTGTHWFQPHTHTHTHTHRKRIRKSNYINTHKYIYIYIYIYIYEIDVGNGYRSKCRWLCIVQFVTGREQGLLPVIGLQFPLHTLHNPTHPTHPHRHTHPHTRTHTDTHGHTRTHTDTGREPHISVSVTCFASFRLLFVFDSIKQFQLVGRIHRFCRHDPFSKINPDDWMHFSASSPVRVLNISEASPLVVPE